MVIIIEYLHIMPLLQNNYFDYEYHVTIWILEVKDSAKPHDYFGDVSAALKIFEDSSMLLKAF